MARRILCLEHGKPKPTPPEDLARGLDCRWRHGILTCSVVCDTCAVELPAGSEAVCFTQPSSRIGDWEPEYILEGEMFVTKPTGTFVIFDKARYTLALTINETIRPVLQQAVERLQQEHAEHTASLDLVCEEERRFGSTFEHRLYYAHPGTYAFVPNGDLRVRRHEFKGTAQTCEECGFGPNAEVHA